MSVEKITAENVFAKMNELGEKETISRVEALINNVRTLLESISNLIEDEKEIAALFGVGFVAAISSADSVDSVAQMGTKRGIVSSIQALAKEVFNESNED